MNNLLYITFYTDGYYQQIAEKWIIPSFQKFNLSYKAYRRPNLNDWVLNTRQKIDVIEEALIDHPNHDIIFIDSDGEIVSEPKLFKTIPDEYDLSIHYLDWHKNYGRKTDIDKKEPLSGTIWLKNNQKILNLMSKWKDLTVKYNWEQQALEELLKTENINVYELPWSYCYILNQPNGSPPAHPLENPVIVHHQISRVVKKNKGLLK